MRLTNGKTIGFYNNKITYSNYCYDLHDFVYAKTLAELLDDINEYNECFKVMSFMYKFYEPIATSKRTIQHAGCRGITKQRNGKMADYRLYKKLLNQIKKLQLELGFERKCANV